MLLLLYVTVATAATVTAPIMKESGSIHSQKQQHNTATTPTNLSNRDTRSARPRFRNLSEDAQNDVEDTYVVVLNSVCIV